MDAYVAKPIQPERLFAVLARHCRKNAVPTPGPTAMQEGNGGGATRPDTDEGTDEMLARVAGIPGIDAETAISRLLGRRDLYAQLVRRVAGDARACSPRSTMRGATATATRWPRRSIPPSPSSACWAPTPCSSAASNCSSAGEGTETDADVAGFIDELGALLQRLCDATDVSAGSATANSPGRDAFVAFRILACRCAPLALPRG